MTQDQKSDPHMLKATGPRTLSGKKRSRRNAISHGIYARDLLLNSERPEEFWSLFRDLEENLHVEGALEEHLVLHLAMLMFRKSRLLKAETAEIAKTAEFLGYDHFFEKSAQASRCINELVAQYTNPEALQRGIELLADLRHSFEHRGFDQEQDIPILRKIYGLGNLQGNFPSVYIALNVPNQESDKRGEISRMPDDIKKMIIGLIDQELARFKSLKSEIDKNESLRLHFVELASLVPRQEVQDRFQRYECHLGREIDRTLSQLELVQRMRLSLHLLPPITVTRG